MNSNVTVYVSKHCHIRQCLLFIVRRFTHGFKCPLLCLSSTQMQGQMKNGVSTPVFLCLLELTPIFCHTLWQPCYEQMCDSYACIGSFNDSIVILYFVNMLGKAFSFGGFPFSSWIKTAGESPSERLMVNACSWPKLR